jgi:hypothetical protein
MNPIVVGPTTIARRIVPRGTAGCTAGSDPLEGISRIADLPNREGSSALLVMPSGTTGTRLGLCGARFRSRVKATLPSDTPQRRGSDGAPVPALRPVVSSPLPSEPDAGSGAITGRAISAIVRFSWSR